MFRGLSSDELARALRGLPAPMMPRYWWCGYVRVPSDHPWHNKHYDDDSLLDVQIHGGLSFSEKACADWGPTVPAGWWIGFDMNHYSDHGGSHNLAYQETIGLALQVHESRLIEKYPKVRKGRVILRPITTEDIYGSEQTTTRLETVEEGPEEEGLP
jgi:hypothetical protein